MSQRILDLVIRVRGNNGNVDFTFGGKDLVGLLRSLREELEKQKSLGYQLRYNMELHARLNMFRMLLIKPEIVNEASITMVAQTLTLAPANSHDLCSGCGRTAGLALLESPLPMPASYLCGTCAAQQLVSYCLHCNHRNQGHYHGYPIPVCSSCRSRNPRLFPQCHSCHLILGPGDRKAGLCDDCARAGLLVPYSTDVVHSMGYRAPSPLYYEVRAAGKLAGYQFSARKQQLGLMGIELELETNSAEARLALRDAVAEFAILKADSSLDASRGVEVVSLPMSLVENYLRWRPAFESVIVSHCQATARCGLHVHIDTPGVLGSSKIIKFINRPWNREFIQQVAGRHLNEYCEPSPVDHQSVRTAIGGTDHHSAVAGSRRNNRRSLELRIFASTINFDLFMARLEFADAIRMFAQDTAWDSLLTRDFMGWLKQQSYPYLQALLKMRKTWPKALPIVGAVEDKGFELRATPFQRYLHSPAEASLPPGEEDLFPFTPRGQGLRARAVGLQQPEPTGENAPPPTWTTANMASFWETAQVWQTMRGTQQQGNVTFTGGPAIDGEDAENDGEDDD